MFPSNRLRMRLTDTALPTVQVITGSDARDLGSEVPGQWALAALRSDQCIVPCTSEARASDALSNFELESIIEGDLEVRIIHC
jgi:hypothetical protein